MTNELRYFLNSRYGRLPYEIEQSGNESKGQIVVKWPMSEPGNIPVRALTSKMSQFFCEQMPGKRLEFKFSKNRTHRTTKIEWTK